MRSLNLILMLLAALSVLMLGAAPASAVDMAGDAIPPCHEVPASSPPHDGGPDPSEEAGKDMAAIACCAGCVVAQAARPWTREQVLLYSVNRVPDGLEPSYGGDPDGGMVFAPVRIE